MAGHTPSKLSQEMRKLKSDGDNRVTTFPSNNQDAVPTVMDPATNIQDDEKEKEKSGY
ncbi:hypothetical protein [Parapedobacter deserti]|uniref:hypothetical protein n=1 Tax=Parapedobacter deserti TaxID=1912957 RepID=UPI003672234E